MFRGETEDRNDSEWWSFVLCEVQIFHAWLKRKQRRVWSEEAVEEEEEVVGVKLQRGGGGGSAGRSGRDKSCSETSKTLTILL